MNMKDYLSSTGDAVSPMFNVIRDSSEKLFELGISIHHWIHLENYLLGKEHKGWGPLKFDKWQKDMGEDPTVESVQFWRGKLESMVEARNEAINTLCASILMIAQAGIKLVLGKPTLWKVHEGTLLSSQSECLLSAIWHGRNLGAHVEGLSPQTPSFVYFQDIRSRRNIDLLSPAIKYPCKYIVKDLLGWIELHDLPIKDSVHTESHPSPYVQDMLRIGSLTAPTN
ncbi:hypothetical protein [Pseudomonas sp. ACM7]|uniref:hypothetical protein n=1 Tax=Pseudomonas sp. ACM7 TaxID=2052956 RepID=UPI001011C3DF|nr:hypothetical protein [Pseudomonas sp. ACM7]QAY88618.1 hypothetical protein CUN63_00965 [Pseudomonas sp. ACM7]